MTTTTTTTGAFIACLATALCGDAGARPTSPPGRLESAHLVDVKIVAPGVRVDLRYASTRNVIGRAFYPRGARALLRRPLALRLRRALRFLRARGLTLLIWDAYRPPAAQRVLWRHTPDPKLVAPPSRGSIHTRGAALDLTLARASDGRPLEMPTPYDSSSTRARRGARKGVSRKARRNSALLARAMARAGFVPYAAEWWHFNARDYRRYPLLTVSLTTP